MLKDKFDIKYNYILISAYVIGHFIVDFACAYLMYRMLYVGQQWNPSLLFYNFCAFALQMPIGILADRWNRNALCASIGCVMIALAFGFGSKVIVAALMAGIGNGLFHVGGGIDILNLSRKKAGLLGVFVSPGAFGIYFGTICGKQNIIPGWLVVIIILAIAVVMLFGSFMAKKSFHSDNIPLSFQRVALPGILISIGCLFIVVCLRSYLGLVLNFPWKGQGSWGVIAVCAVVFGKMSGGFLADKIGAMKASIVSLGIASLLYLFSDSPLPGIFAVCFFNMTMPITLWAVARILQGSKGFSFGLLTFGLFLGFIPVYLELPVFLSTTAGFSLAALVSLILLLIGLRKVVV